MKSPSFVHYLIAILIVHSSATSAPAAATAIGQKKVTYDIPSSFSANSDLITKFQAVSSHGRADDTPTTTYTSFQVVTRAFYLLMVFAPMFCTSGLAFVSSWYRNGIWFGLLRFGISKGGAAFIKWAQWASTRPDIFPEELCSVLSSLQSGAPEHSFAFTCRQIKSELGAPINEIFEFFSKRPIASGSIAQVYKARLNGQDVAVKVRHPNVEEQIGIDFIIMKAVASLIDSVPGLEWLKLSETMSQFSATIASQTDLGVEGRHLYLFNHYFKKWSGVSFPKPIILTDSILVETFEFGDSVDKYTKTLNCNGNISQTEAASIGLDIKGIEIEKIAEAIRQCNLAHFIVTTGEDTYLKMLLQDNLMHADLHPGNILIQQSYAEFLDPIPTEIPKIPSDQTVLVASMPSFVPPLNTASIVLKKENPVRTKIILVDAGMVARLVPTEQKNFIGLLEAMGEGRGDEAADCVMKFSDKPDYDINTKIGFRQDMKNLFLIDCKGYGSDVNIGRALRGILNLVRIHKVTIDANYATLVMNCLCLDSMAHSLLPSYNILDGAKPLLRFNRIFKRIPGSFFLLKAAIPIAQWVKRRNDRIFLSDLKKQLNKLLPAK